MKKEWIVKKINDTSKSVLENLLEQRGFKKPEDIDEFLNPNKFKVISPYAFCDMKKAIERIKKAIDDKEKILVYGDFDADGITSTSLLVRAFRKLNAEVDYFIPEREKHGHGLNFKALIGVMSKRKPNLIITVDCGVSNIKEVEQLKAFGIDTIITDHHEAQEILPKAIAIINPKAPYKIEETLTTKEIESLTSLAGVGVAYKLAGAILEEYKIDSLDLLTYVAVGTISDVVPLVYENRFFVQKGLELISSGKHYGFKRLIEESGYKLENGLTSEQIAFGVTPRINATGRLDNVVDSVNVLISDNQHEIDMAIISLNNCNKIRQELCDNTFLEAKDMPQSKNAIILFKKDWHIGIIGIVASRLVEMYNKPTFLMTYSEETKQIRCSSRSVEGVNIFDVLTANSELFDNFGGHAMAGGFSFTEENHSFEEVKKALNSTIDEIIGEKSLTPILKIDLELEFDDLNAELLEDINKLEPFGADNQKPLFVMKNLTLLQKKLIGSNKNHLKLIVQDSIGNTYDCLWWSKGDISLTSGDVLDLAFYPQLNTFNGTTSIQLIIEDIHSDKMQYEEPKSLYTIYDHRKKVGIFNSIEDYLKTTKVNVGIFAEDTNVIDVLKSYPQIFQRIFNRTSKNFYDSIMFFDYPASKELFESVIKNTNAKVFHFMKYEQKHFDEKAFFKTFIGMIRYSCNHYDGLFNISKAAAKASLPEDVIIEVLNEFEAIGLIDILDRTEDGFKIKLVDADYSKILHSENYSQILSDIKISQDFKVSFSNADLNYFCNIS